MAVLGLHCCGGFLYLQQAGATLQLQFFNFSLLWLLWWSAGSRAGASVVVHMGSVAVVPRL